MDAGWTAATGFQPVAVTWHWTATATLAETRQLIGGEQPSRRGQASAHVAIGRSFAEGMDVYVGFADRSWHAGLNQTLGWDGRPLLGPERKASRTAIGIETVNLGYAREGVPAGADWIPADSPDGQLALRIQPWSEEQIAMMVALGKELCARFPHIAPADHHGHHDICPSYKLDVLGFPFARVLRAIYDDPQIPDIWTPLWTVAGRKRALNALGYRAGKTRSGWGKTSQSALRRFQLAHGLVADGMWTVFVSRKVFAALGERGLRLADVVADEGA